jgi:hypothetical protein
MPPNIGPCAATANSTGEEGRTRWVFNAVRRCLGTKHVDGPGPGCLGLADVAGSGPVDPVLYRDVRRADARPPGGPGSPAPVTSV